MKEKRKALGRPSLKNTARNLQCGACQTKKAHKFYGMKSGKIRCAYCYSKEKRESRKSLDESRFLAMWER